MVAGAIRHAYVIWPASEFCPVPIWRQCDMSWHQKTVWILKCGGCNSETEVGVRPAHLTVYQCRSCSKPEPFVYPLREPDGASRPNPEGPTKIEDKRNPIVISLTTWPFWERVLSSVLVAGLLGVCAFLASLPVFREIIRQEIRSSTGLSAQGSQPRAGAKVEE